MGMIDVITADNFRHICSIESSHSIIKGIQINNEIVVLSTGGFLSIIALEDYTIRHKIDI
jgi:hypothetical protein